MTMLDEYGAADYSKWLEREGWSMFEAACLLLGVEPPNPVSFDESNNLVINGVYGSEADRLIELWHDSQRMQSLPERFEYGGISYFKVYDILAWAKKKGISLPRKLVEAQKSGGSPIWILRAVEGGFWLCGPEHEPIKLKGVRGINDLINAVKNKGKDLDPVTDNAATEEQVDQAQSLKYAKADEEIDSATRGAVKQEIQKLEDEAEIAEETGDPDARRDAVEKIAQLREYLDGSTRPGGRSRTFSESDPYVKATKAMRDRKNTLVNNLRSAGLNDIADHVDSCLNIRNRSYSYTPGPPNPQWKFE